MPISKERFFLGHNLILSNVPEKVEAKVINQYLQENSKLDVTKFGLFDTAAPNFNNYYPNLTPEDLKPKDEDFVYPLVRALSAITLNRYGPIEFPASVLKSAVQLLVGQTVYPNHEDSVGNELGVVQEAFWGKGYTTKEGIKIPPGINARLKIDGKTNPKTARGMVSNPPSVHSFSVGVLFDWVKSHPEISDDDFWGKLGSYDANGNLIRRIVKSILAFEEISAVKHGQDPYAQILDKDGKVNNPLHADIHNALQNKFSAQDYETNGSFFDWKALKRDRVKLTWSGAIPTNLINTNNNSTKNNEPMNEELLKFLRKQLGLADNATEAEVLVKLQQFLPDNIAKLAKAETDLQTANTSLTALKAKYPEGSEILSKEDKASFEALKTEAAERLTALRGETLKLYQLSAGGADKAKQPVIDLIASANLAACTALYDQYNSMVEKDHKLSCEDCGSHKIKRASAKGAKLGVTTTEGEIPETPETFTPKSDAEVMAQLTKRPSNSLDFYKNK